MMIRIVLLFGLLVFYLANISILSHTYTYSEPIESLFPKIRPWAKNAEYTINYFGLTHENTLHGRKSLKMDITVMGNADKECYYYWAIPIRLKHYGEIIHSAAVWADSNASKYLSVGINFIYPPDSAKFNFVKQSDKWQKISDTLSSFKTEPGFLSFAGFNDDYSDGRELNKIGIFIRARGKHRLTFFLNDIVLKGKTFNISDFQKYLRYKWDSFKTKNNISVNSFPSTAPGYMVENTNRIPLGMMGSDLIKESAAEREKVINLYNKIEKSNRLKIEEIIKFRDLHSSYMGKTKLFNSGINKPEVKAVAFNLPATKFNRLTGSNIPDNVEPLEKLSARVCPDQYESFSILLQPKKQLDDVKITYSDFKGAGGVIKASALDILIAKVWYQAGIKSTEVNKKLLTQELLLKNDNLVKIDYTTKTNYLLVKDKSGNEKYVDISSPGAVFPEGVTVSDSKTLKPFSVAANTNKQIWFTLHVPEDTKPGRYRGQITIKDSREILLEIPVEFQVLPFKLDPSRLTNSIYYHGALRDWKLRPFHCEDKTPEQLEIELADMKEHGVLYPNNYQDVKNLAKNLEIRNKVGLPKDKLFSALLDWCTGLPKTDRELNEFKARIRKFKDIANRYGYKDLYIYGIDEARGDKLLAQRPAWKAAHEVGAKIFVAGYYETFSDIGDLLDLGIIQGPLNREQAALYHSVGNEIFSYSNPQVGQENPEIYRRNFGFALWKAGYDGSMDYAYQKNYGSIWNDFDNSRYREEVFTYPTSNGIISTIQWEGFRQGINDLRFISTLLNKIDRLKASGKNTGELEKWVNSIDPSEDLDEIRNKVIDKILSITSL